MLVFEGNAVWDKRSFRCWSEANIDDFGDFPELNDDAHTCFDQQIYLQYLAPKGQTLTKQNHPASILVVVQKVEEDNSLHEDITEDRTD